MLFGGGAMATRCSIVLVGLLLAATARGAESTATFRVGVRVVRPFAVHSPAAGSAATRVERGGARATSLARVIPPGTAFRVGVWVVRPFAVQSTATATASDATRVGRGGAQATSLARVMPPGTAPGGAVLAGARGAIHLPCDLRGCEVALSEAGGRTVLLTVFPDGAPVALVER